MLHQYNTIQSTVIFDRVKSKDQDARKMLCSQRCHSITILVLILTV